MQHRHLWAVRLGALLSHQGPAAAQQPGCARGTRESHAFRSQSTLTPDHHQECARKPSARYWFCIRENAMSTNLNTIRDLAEREYKWGFVTSVEEERVPKGLNEDIIRVISAKKNEPELMLQWRLRAHQHWASLEKAQGEPKCANVKNGPIAYQDRSFVYVPKGVRCPMELSTYFRINAANAGQFERTLIVADEGSYVSYLEGCTAPIRDENQLHAAVVELIALDNAQIKYSTVQNWYPGDKEGKGGLYNFVTRRRKHSAVNSNIPSPPVTTTPPTP